MMEKIWQVLPSQSIRKAIENKIIFIDEIDIIEDQIQPASLDLRVGKTAYQVKAGFLPGKDKMVQECIDDFKIREIDLINGAVLLCGEVYIIPLLEKVNIPTFMEGITNPKSSIGRLDVFVRIITDQGIEFDRICEKYEGQLYAEVSTRTFNIKIRTGTKLAQLRLQVDMEAIYNCFCRSWNMSDELSATIPNTRAFKNDIYIREFEVGKFQTPFSVDITGNPHLSIIGYKSQTVPHKDTLQTIDVDLINHYKISEHWEPIYKRNFDYLVLEPNAFYILASKESVSVKPIHAAEMQAYDTSIGEFRVHYAGFFDPGFGYGTTDTKAVLEVRAHDVPFIIRDGQLMGNLVYTKMIETPDKLYGKTIASNYQNQGLRLGKQFKQ